MGGSSKGGGGGKGGGSSAAAAPAVAQPPVSNAPIQQLSAVESQFVNAPWSEPGWQGNTQPAPQQYLDLEDYNSSTSSGANQPESAGLAQWLFGGGD